MNRWNIFVFVALTVVCYGVCKSHSAAVAAAAGKTEDIGVRAMPDHDSEAMAEFKSGLNTEEKDLLKRHMSKTRFIQPMVDSKRVLMNRRNKLVQNAVKKRNEVTSSGCCSCRDHNNGCYHPDDVKRSNIIQCCQGPPSAPETVAVSERGVQVNKAGQAALSGLSPEDQALLQRHSSKIKNLIEAEKRPESNGNTDKREQDDEAETVANVDAEEQQALESLSQEDKDLMTKYLSKIDNLVEAEHRPESNGNTDKREQMDIVESNEATGSALLQKLYDQLEGIKRVVGDLKAQQQHVERKSVHEPVSDISKVHKASGSQRGQ